MTLNSLFEEGLLSGNKVSSQNDQVCQNVTKAYNVLSEWAKERVMAGENIRSRDNKTFLAWQVIICRQILIIKINLLNIIF